MTYRRSRYPLVRSRVSLVSGVRRRAIARPFSLLLVASQLVVGIPIAASASPSPAAQDAAKVVQAPIVANRHVPVVLPPPTVQTLTDTPTDAELSAAHIFSEPLIPMPRGTTPAENRALAQALRLYANGNRAEMVAPLLQFLARYPQSAWKATLLANLGFVYRRTGYLSRAFNAWEMSWNEAKDETDPRARAVADFAIGEWFELSHKLGRPTNVVERVQEVEGRHLSGRAGQQMALAAEGVWVTRVHHDVLASGAAAIESLLAFRAYEQHVPHVPAPAVQAYHSVPAGMSLAEVKTLAAQAGLNWVMFARPTDTPYSVPAIVHLRADHFVAIVKQEAGRYLMIDPAAGGERWISREALEDEGSGYILAPKTTATNAWRAVPAAEAAGVVGHCTPGAPYDLDPGSPPPCGCGMPQYVLQHMPASLRLVDTPLSYQPPIGPAVPFRLVYNQRDGSQPQAYSSGNLGPKWTMDLLTWVADDPTAPDVEADVYLSGGGGEHYADGVAHTVFVPNWRSKAVLAKVSSNPVRYERRLPDGGMQVFAQSDGVVTAGRRVYLTDIIDSQGLTVHLTYDASLRLVAVTDAIGLVTTVSYELASDPLKITKITDPYGRFARLTYNVSGQLASVTDAINLTSSFIYGDNDFVQSLTTPYGTTLFTHETSGANPNTYRFIQATDPLGGTERVEFRWSHPDIPATAPMAQVPTGFSAYNNTLDRYNSVYWDKRAMLLGAGDVTKATITHWLLYTYQQYVPFFYSHAFSVSVPHSVKKPLENRVWYAYPDQDVNGLSVGSFSLPTKTARVLDDGTSQITQTTYTAQGQVASRTDPVGRQTSYTYAANGIDLVQTRQTTNGANDVLGTFANYTGQYEPQSTTDAAGQTTSVSYNAAGQLLTVTNARQETSTY